MCNSQLFHADIPATVRLTSSLLAELIVTCLRGLSEPVVTSKLSGDLLTHLRAASEGQVKLYVVKCLIEEMPEQQYGEKFNTCCSLYVSRTKSWGNMLYCHSVSLTKTAAQHKA